MLYSAPDNAPDGLYITDTELFSVPAPGFEAAQRSLGYAVHLRINSHGLRGGPVGDARPRWLAAGDSFTMAAQVSEEESFVGLLCAGGAREVLNGGVDGYGTWQALRRYERLDDSLGVDGLVLVFFAGNDLADNARWEMVRTQAAGLNPGEPIWRPSQGALHRWLYPRSVLYARLHMLLRSRALADSDNPELQRWAAELLPFTRDGRAALQALIQQTEPALDALRASTEARGDRLVVAIAPPAFQIESARREATMALVGLEPARAAPNQVTAAISDVLAQKGIASCDLVGPLRAAHSAGERLYLAYDGHWSPAGHRVVARALAGCIDDH
jgi:lysophospholipase L1-like esterase